MIRKSSGKDFCIAVYVSMLAVGCGGISERTLDDHAVPVATVSQNNAPPELSDIVSEKHAATIGYVAESGRFNVVSRVRISGAPDGSPQLDLAISGDSKSEALSTLGMSIQIDQAMSRRLLLGESVAVDGLSMLNYGPAAAEVMRPVAGLQLKRLAPEVWELRVTLQRKALYAENTPKRLGQSPEAVFVGELAIECVVPGPAEEPERVTEDPELRSEFCSNAVRSFGLELLVK
jgi:hypothetical protein